MLQICHEHQATVSHLPFSQKLNDAAAALFESCKAVNVAESINRMNELIIPCMHLLVSNNISKDDLDAIEVMRSRWCSYLGKDMDGKKPRCCCPDFLLHVQVFPPS